MFRLVDVKALNDHVIWVKFEDGVEGEVDLSGFIARGGLFKEWGNRTFFDSVLISDDNTVKWGDSDFHELCGDSLYMKVTGISIEEYSKRSNTNLIHA